jgi:hypothetical protein
MQDSAVIVDTGKISVPDQGDSLSVAPLFAGQGRQCRNVPQRAGSGLGLQSHRSLDDQVGAMSAVLDNQLLSMAARGFAQSAAESNVADALDQIQNTGSMAAVPSHVQACLPITCAVPKVGEPPEQHSRRVSILIAEMCR